MLPASPRICLFVFLLTGLLVSCQRGDPQARPLEAANPGRLATWRMKMAESFRPEEWREFDAALQEIRLRIMADREASGSEAIEAALCRRIDGRTFREVLILGDENKLARLDPVRRELKSAIDGNAKLVTKPGDDASAKYLDGYRARQEERLTKVDAEIAEAEQRLAAIGGPEWAAKIAERQKTTAHAVAAAVLSRDEALDEIKTLLRAQHDAALLKYGGWPIKIERSAAGVPEENRADFVARQTAAATNGHVVLAMHLRERWWIYDDTTPPPTFSSSVLTNLTEADRQQIAEWWQNFHGELWARRQDREQPDPSADAVQQESLAPASLAQKPTAR